MTASKWIGLGLIAICVGCGSAPQDPAAPAVRGAEDVSGFTADALALRVAEPRLEAATLSILELDALSLCQCQDNLQTQWQVNVATGDAHLPSVFFAEIRERVRADPDLKSLRDLMGDLGVALVPDDQVATGVRDALSNEIAKALGKPVAKSLPLHVDGFSRYFTDDQPQQISMQAASAIWSAHFRDESYWGQKDAASSIAGTANLMRTLLEWQYIFGIALDSAAPATRGGLVIQIDDPTLRAFDPRNDVDGYGYLGGTYQVSWTVGNLATLATSGQESWQLMDAALDLRSRIRIWSAAASALQRLRPKNRALHGGLFGEESILPEEAYLLPLAFLPGMKRLLRDVFVDRDAEVIRSDLGARAAGASDLAALLTTLIAWHQQLSDVSDLALDAKQKERLHAALANLEDLGRLAIRQIIDQHLIVANGGLDVVTLSGDQATRETALEVLGGLTIAGDTLYPSPYLEEQIAAVALQLESRYAGTDVTWREVFLLAALPDREPTRNLRQAGHKLLLQQEG